MLVYYIVIFLVVLFAGIAEQLDYKPKDIDADSDSLQPLSFTGVSHTRNACYFFILSSLVMVFVAGLRYYVGADYGGYYFGWLSYADELEESILHLDEPGYRLICALFQKIGISDGAYPIFLASVITVGGALCIIYYNTEHLWLASVLFLLMYWDAGFNAVRQCLAATFTFCGYAALRDKKLWEYLIWVGIAFLFHRSAICMFFPYFFVHNEITNRNMALLILGCFIFLHSYDYAFRFTGAILDKDFGQIEFGSYNLYEVNRLRILFNCVPAVFFYIWIINQKSSISNLHVFWMNILLFKAASSLAAMNSPYLSRIGIYFSPFLILAYCGLIDTMPKQERRFWSLGLCIYCGIFFLYEVSNSTTLRNYHFIWER